MAGSIAELRERYRLGQTTPVKEVEVSLARSNTNAGKNVYLAQDGDWTLAEAGRLRLEDIERLPLWGVPVSLKDCFDLAGFRTSCGSRFYQETLGVAARDSAVAEKLRAAGAVIVGKTHLHQLAYGITGENRDFGDCVQPRNARWLTGGSVRAPAALCGLAGYRASITLQGDVWRGGAHLAETFDTVGWIYRDLADGPLLAQVLYDLPEIAETKIAGLRVGVPDGEFLQDCEADVAETLRMWRGVFEERGAVVSEFDAEFWGEAMEVFAPIQAHEAARLHRGNFEHFEAAIAERLRWGASIAEPEVARLRARREVFCARMAELFGRFDFLLLPCCPMSSLAAGADQSQTRMRILRYTAPMSLAGLPVVTLPGSAGGLQLVGRLGGDAEVLALSAVIAEAR